MYNKLKINIMKEEKEIENFKPVGAMVFLLLLMFLGTVIWFGIYYLMMIKS